MHKCLFFLVLIVLAACGGTEKDKGKLLAKVEDRSLYVSDIEALIEDNWSSEDSLAFVKSYTDKWIREMVIVLQAEQTLPDQAKNVDARLENYRRDLLIYAFEREYASQKLDTVVSDQEIEAHYNENIADFKLADFVLKVLYIKLDKKEKGQDKVAQWYKSTNQKDLLNLEKYCAENAVNYYNDNENWIYFSDLLREIPLAVDNPIDFLKNNKHSIFSDEDFTYYLNIYDYQLKDATSPLSLERENIKLRILNQRTTELIRKMRIDLYTNATPAIKNYVEE